MKKVGNFWVPDQETLQVEALTAGGWQLDHLEAALKHVTSWAIAVDGGANIGSWTQVMAQRFHAVHAFEPAPDTFECLVKNMVGYSNVRMHPFALGEKPGTSGMEDDGKYSGGNTGGRYLSGEGKIEVVTLDRFGLKALGFLKLDIEGYELFALRGARETILRCRPVILVENKPRLGYRFGVELGAVERYLEADLGAKHLGHVGADHFYGFL